MMLFTCENVQCPRTSDQIEATNRSSRSPLGRAWERNNFLFGLRAAHTQGDLGLAKANISDYNFAPVRNDNALSIRYMSFVMLC